MKNLTNFLIAIITVFVITANVSAQITSAASGNWDTGSTWVGGNVPTSADNVVIASDHTVTVDVNTAACNNISFGAATSKLAMASGSVLSVYGNFNLFSTSHTAFSSWASGAKLKFAGSAAQSITNLSTSTTTTTQTFFMEILVDKSGDTLRIPDADVKLNIGTSFEILSGNFRLGTVADIQGRNIDGSEATTPIIVVRSGGLFFMAGGASHIGSGTSGTPRPPIGKVTIHGSMNLVATSTNNINFEGVDIENGGTLTISLGTTASRIAPGTITIKSGGTLLNVTTTNVWVGSSSFVILNSGGVYRTNSSTTFFPTFTTNNGTVRFGGSIAQAVNDMDYNRLEFSFSGTKTWTLGANRVISDSLEINNSATLILAGTGTPTVNGTLRLTSGTLDNSSRNIALANDAIISRATGTITNAPSFGSSVNLRYTSTTSNVTTGPELPTSSSVLNDFTTTSTMTVTLGADATLNGNLTLSAGTFDNDGSANDKVLTLANGATIRRATGVLTAAPTFGSSMNLEYISTVGHVTTGYEVPSSVSVLNNLSITGNQGVTLGSALTVNGILTLSGSSIILGSSNLTLGASATVSGTPSASNMIVATGSGELRKQFSSTGSFTFPVGDNTGTEEYSPVTLNFTSGSFSTAYAAVRLENIKHPNNTSTTDYIDRYWKVTQSGISSFTCDADFVYAEGDIVGNETNMVLGQLGTQWDVVGTCNPTTNTLSATGLTSFSDFTGGEMGALPIQLASFVGSYVGNSAKLEWSTISEVNNYGFNVQRLNGNEFVTIGFVAGKGTTLEPQSYSYLDVNAGTSYRLEQIDNNGLKNYFGPVMLNPNSVDNNVPAVFKLNQNYPNPFNPTTKISFSLANAGYTTLKVYNIVGSEIATLFTGNAEAGRLYTINFDAKNLTSGMYFTKLVSGNSVEIRKMTLIK